MITQNTTPSDLGTIFATSSSGEHPSSFVRFPEPRARIKLRHGKKETRKRGRGNGVSLDEKKGWQSSPRVACWMKSSCRQGSTTASTTWKPGPSQRVLPGGHDQSPKCNEFLWRSRASGALVLKTSCLGRKLGVDLDSALEGQSGARVHSLRRRRIMLAQKTASPPCKHAGARLEDATKDDAIYVEFDDYESEVSQERRWTDLVKLSSEGSSSSSRPT